MTMTHKEIDDEDERFMQCEKMPVDGSLEYYAQHLRALASHPNRSFSDFKRKEAEHDSGFAFAEVLIKTSSGKSMGKAICQLRM